MKKLLRLTVLLPILAACGRQISPQLEALPQNMSSSDLDKLTTANTPDFSNLAKDGWIEVVKGGWQKITYDDQGRVLLKQQYVEAGSLTGAKWFVKQNQTGNDIDKGANTIVDYLEKHSVTQDQIRQLSLGSCTPGNYAGVYNGYLLAYGSATCSETALASASVNDGNRSVYSNTSSGPLTNTPWVTASIPVFSYDYNNVCARASSWIMWTGPLYSIYYGGNGSCTR